MPIVTERDYLTAEDSPGLVRFITSRWRISNRKGRLLGCAFYREHKVPLRVTEAEPADMDSFYGIIEQAEQVADGTHPSDGWNDFWLVRTNGSVICDTCFGTTGKGYPPDMLYTPEFRRKRADIFREIMGNPFRPFVLGDDLLGGEGMDYIYQIHENQNPENGQWRKIRNLTPKWYWKTAKEKDHQFLLQSAKDIYNRRAWEDLPLLSDLLQDCGCTLPSMIEHFQGWEPCPSCEGEGGNHGPEQGPLPWGGYEVGEWVPCEECKGSRKRAVVHHLGCSYLDALLNLY